jgi:hypothetical protein
MDHSSARSGRGGCSPPLRFGAKPPARLFDGACMYQRLWGEVAHGGEEGLRVGYWGLGGLVHRKIGMHVLGSRSADRAGLFWRTEDSAGDWRVVRWRMMLEGIEAKKRVRTLRVWTPSHDCGCEEPERGREGVLFTYRRIYFQLWPWP